MKYVFFGTPEFAAVILKKLIDAGMPPSLVVCNPDKPSGRKKIITPPPAKIISGKYGIPVWQPEKLEIRNLKLEIEKLGGIDFAVVAAYAKVITKEVLDFLPAKFLGVHPSLLPKYRGATPIQSVILNGESETGTTLFLLDEKVDHGAILAKSEIKISKSETYKSLHAKLAELSGGLLIEILPKFVKNEIRPQVQSEEEATFTKKFSAEDAFVDLENDNLTNIERKIRALNPEPGVWTLRQVQGRQSRIKILEQKTVQFEGKKPRSVEDAISFLKSL